ncbi:hypothetical protein GCM10010123_25170 [Pilimelia anulata]|uniref:Uncharacterized protein n=1 Tax=Pilimelia anulata TaxID=53371 RepID=A0A8J3F9U0_9ACTN|nr:hypothetical protein [Pilimelia anulata]GGJ94290.1 hypothetical protein GCM10010123_25170 [Pilimelia anulata]
MGTHQHAGRLHRLVRALRSPRSRGLASFFGLAVAASVVYQSTAGTFSATTSNPGIAFAMGSLSLSDNDSGVALFTVSGMAPGQTASNCIVISYTGAIASTVKLYTANYNATDGAADGATAPNWLRMHIQVGTGTCGAPVGLTSVTAGAPGDTMTTVSGKTNFGNGYGTGWTNATGGDTRVFRFTYTLDSAAPNTAQSDGITTDFVWEAQSN